MGHAKYSPPKKNNALEFGKATHIAVLQPEILEASVAEGPEDRRGNKWKDIAEWCAHYGKMPLTASDYSKVMRIRDSAQQNGKIRSLTMGNQLIEHSAYWTDQETGLECRVRPDLYHPQLALIADIKTSENASEGAFSKSIGEYGYHVQEPFYTEGWQAAGGGAVDAFIFIVIEKEFPFAVAVYELKPSAAVEGGIIVRKTLRKWRMCKDAGVWPLYPEEVREIDIRPYDYKELPGDQRD